MNTYIYIYIYRCVMDPVGQFTPPSTQGDLGRAVMWSTCPLREHMHTQSFHPTHIAAQLKLKTNSKYVQHFENFQI